MNNRRSLGRRRRASSLIISLLVIVILSTIVVAFMQSMAVERLVAKSSMNIYRARLAADAGATESMELMQNLFLAYPDSATGWVTNMAPTALTTVRTPGTAFYYYPTVTVTNSNITALTTVMQYRPLVSGATNTVDFTNRTNALSSFANSTNYVNLNSSNYGGGRAWIGTPPSWSGTIPYRVDVPWVELRDSAGKVVSRYAYWIDDESFRVNLNEGSGTPRGSTSQGASPAEIPISGAIKAYDSTNATTLANQIATVRTQTLTNGGLFRQRNINYASASYPALSDSVGFISTVNSSGLNVSRTGARRVNLNTVIPLTNSTNARAELDGIISTITNQAPLFGQRFFRVVGAGSLNATNTSKEESEIYLNKLAANIRDYIDVDNQPTLVESGGTVYPGGAPTFAMASGDFWAVGKENVPRLQESFVHVQQLASMATAGSPSPWSVRIAYYFEFWNMGTTDISVASLGPNAFLRVVNQPEWYDAATGNVKIQNPPDFQIPLSEFVHSASTSVPLVFRAGEVTVLTTDPVPDQVGYALPVGVPVYRPNPANGSLIAALNTAPHVYSSGPGTNNYVGAPAAAGWGGFGTLALMGRQGTWNSAPSSAASADANWDSETEVLLGNDFGYLESHPYSVVIKPGIYVDAFSSASPNLKMNRVNFHWRGGALTGNVTAPYTGIVATPFQVGDPRANNEQLTFTGPAQTGNKQTAFARWRNPTQQQSVSGADEKSTMGSPNTDYLLPAGGNQNWDEGNNTRTTSSFAAGGSPAFVRNGQMQSIGELGNIYDPMRIITAVGDKSTTLGGGRTLRIGRPESVTASGGSALQVIDTNSVAVSRRWAAWRLTDMFSVRDDPESQPGQLAGTKGMINPNGALRDSGAAFLATLEGLAYSQDNALTDSPLKGATLGTNAVTLFRTYLTNALTTGQPFFERGELSELTAFNFNIAAMLSPNPGVNTLQANDRSREEIFRRMVEMITTKGNTFTVYIVGQAVTDLPNGTRRVDSSQTRKVTFRLEPRYAYTARAFDPSDPDQVTARLAAPTSYELKILSQSDN